MNTQNFQPFAPACPPISVRTAARISIFLFCSVLLNQSEAHANTSDLVPQSRSSDHRFENVDIEHIYPDDLHGPDASATKAPISYGSEQLPRVPTPTDLKQLHESLQGSVVKVLAVHKPAAPFRQAPLYYEGHAVWLAPARENTRPILVTTLDWLNDARHIYILPAQVSGNDTKRTSRRQHTTTFQSLDSVTSGDVDQRWFKKNVHKFIEVTLQNGDSSRNLVQLVSVDKEELPSANGLSLYNLQAIAPDRVYGYSPYLPTPLIETRMVFDPPKHEALAFYLQTSFTAILGAPIVASNGHLVALTAIKNPQEPEFTLLIPLTALSQYLHRATSSAGTR